MLQREKKEKRQAFILNIDNSQRGG